MAELHYKASLYSEVSPILSIQGEQELQPEQEGKSSFFSTVLTLANGALGSGILALRM